MGCFSSDSAAAEFEDGRDVGFDEFLASYFTRQALCTTVEVTDEFAKDESKVAKKLAGLLR